MKHGLPKCIYLFHQINIWNNRGIFYIPLYGQHHGIGLSIVKKLHVPYMQLIDCWT